MLRLIDPARLDQMTIDERVLTGNLGGGAPRHLPSDAECLDDRNREASTCQQISRGETDNSSTDYRDVSAAGLLYFMNDAKKEETRLKRIAYLLKQLS